MNFTKLRCLEGRHRGINEKVHAMFEQFWPVAQIKDEIESEYGERLSTRSIERYRQNHWKTQRELVKQSAAALAAFQAQPARAWFTVTQHMGEALWSAVAPATAFRLRFLRRRATPPQRGQVAMTGAPTLPVIRRQARGRVALTGSPALPVFAATLPEGASTLPVGTLTLPVILSPDVLHRGEGSAFALPTRWAEGCELGTGA
jgi:hypothetical protein